MPCFAQFTACCRVSWITRPWRCRRPHAGSDARRPEMEAMVDDGAAGPPARRVSAPASSGRRRRGSSPSRSASGRKPVSSRSGRIGDAPALLTSGVQTSSSPALGHDARHILGDRDIGANRLRLHSARCPRPIRGPRGRGRLITTRHPSSRNSPAVVARPMTAAPPPARGMTSAVFP